MKRYTASTTEVINQLISDSVSGLTEKEAAKRLEFHGRNKLLEKKKPSIISKFFMQFNDFMIIVLLSAAAVSFAVSLMQGEKDFADPLIILAIVFLNALLGLIQEAKAEKSLEALKKMSAPTAKVLRNGQAIIIESENLVPGDIVFLETGDYVPADIRLITSSNLKIEESALTGESVPAEKHADFISKTVLPIGDRLNMAYSGSSVCYGKGTGIVCETGMNTEMGKIAAMIMSHETPETPLQKNLAKTGKQLGIGALLVCMLIFVLGLMRHMPPFDMFIISVSLAVAAIPEGLPAIVTIMLAVGVKNMAKEGAIIRKLPAVETLGCATVICSDKTGTLTQNKMRVVEVLDSVGPLSAEEKGNVLKLAALCTDSRLTREGKEIKVLGEPTEAAIVRGALHFKIDKNELDKTYPRIDDIPFESKRKLMSTIHKTPEGGYVVITKGAPDILLGKCSSFLNEGEVLKLTLSKRQQILNNNCKMAEQALRVIAVAFKELTDKPRHINGDFIENNLTFVGLLGMIDPPRKEAGAAIETCKKAGITPVMITGDHGITAMAIAKKLGLASDTDKALTGEDLSKMTQQELTDNIYKYKVFARVAPEDKVRIVKAFQEQGEVVAMTGDGVNDAPALKIADIGCAMGITGTDVAKGAADMILTDDNFSTIVKSIKSGRGIYLNIKKAVHFLLSSNIGEIISILAAILLGWDAPLLAIHLLWVNLVTDSLPAVALGVDPVDDDIMLNKPVRQSGLFGNGLAVQIALEGCMVGMLALLAFIIGAVYFDGDNHMISRTMCFATLSICQLVHAFNMRSEKSLFKINAFENKHLLLAFLAGMVMQVSVISLPFLNGIFKVSHLTMPQWGIVAFLSLMPIPLVELEKLFQRKFTA